MSITLLQPVLPQQIQNYPEPVLENSKGPSNDLGWSEGQTDSQVSSDDILTVTRQLIYFPECAAVHNAEYGVSSDKTSYNMHCNLRLQTTQ